jgi:hypothetical protein
MDSTRVILDVCDCEDVESLMQSGMPLKDWIEVSCAGCDKKIYLTPKQRAGYMRDAARQFGDNLTIMWRCAACLVECRRAEREQNPD